MRAYDLILKKRQGGSHSLEELKFLIDGYVAGDIADYQMAAWSMAVFFRGMEEQELAWLTQAPAGHFGHRHSGAGHQRSQHQGGGVAHSAGAVLVYFYALYS